MAERGSLQQRLFEEVLEPLIGGGTLVLRKPFGVRGAFQLSQEEKPDLSSRRWKRVQGLRIRAARRLLPVDSIDEVTPGEWALSAAFHDLLQTTNPAFATMLRRGAPARLLEQVHRVAARVGSPRDLSEALSRFATFSRVFDVSRTDVELRWWTGKARFVGQKPPSRLLLWPELRRVAMKQTVVRLSEVVSGADSVPSSEFEGGLRAWFEATPLVDLSTCDRAIAPFEWSPSTLSFVATQGGRRLAYRALERLPADAVDGALGRAVRHLLRKKDRRGALVALLLMADRALSDAERAVTEERADAVSGRFRTSSSSYRPVAAASSKGPKARGPEAKSSLWAIADHLLEAHRTTAGFDEALQRDMSLGRALGALAARFAMAERPTLWSDDRRARLLAFLDARSGMEVWG